MLHFALESFTVTQVLDYLAREVPKPGDMKELPKKLIETGFGPADLRVVACNLASSEKNNKDNTRLLEVFATGLDGAHSAKISIGNEGRNKGLRFQQVNRDAIVPGTYNNGFQTYDDGLQVPLTHHHVNLLEGAEPKLFEEIQVRDEKNELKDDILTGPEANIVQDKSLKRHESHSACYTYERLIKFVEQLISSSPPCRLDDNSDQNEVTSGG